MACEIMLQRGKTRVIRLYPRLTIPEEESIGGDYISDEWRVASRRRCAPRLLQVKTVLLEGVQTRKGTAICALSHRSYR